ncbi:MAG: putative metallopeptidase [Candidatus Roizmanbacteria bacterium]
MQLFKKKKAKRTKFEFEPAPEILELLNRLIIRLEFGHITPGRVFAVRSAGSTARAYARIWGLSRIFQEAAGMPSTYVIEVLSQHFDKLSEKEQTKVLIHELMHIPKTFSGALLSHKGRYHAICERTVNVLYEKLKD